MSDFAYVARNMRGERIAGVVQAGSEREAIAMLASQSLFPVTVGVQKAANNFRFERKVGGQLMAITYGQLASLMRSGVPLLKSIAVIRDQTSHTGLKKVLEDVHRRVEDGATLADAMSRYPKVFSELSVNMVRAGGEGGFLEEALDRVAKFTEQYEDLKGRTAGALAYPIFLGVVGSVIVTVLIVFFVPRFGAVFESLRARGEMPALTEGLLWFSETLRSMWLFALLTVIGLVVVIRARLATDQGRRLSDAVKIRLPILGTVFLHLAVARFCRVLGTMLRNGVPILKSLDVSRDAAGNRVLAEAIRDASENISGGQSLATPLRACGHFPATVVEMISVAEESNTLDTVLVEIADGLEARTQRNLELAVRLLEPLMLLILAGVVLIVVLALLLPAIKMSTTM
ncbi:MAG: type II secretion system F family protein [Pirellulaceae bacterium]